MISCMLVFLMPFRLISAIAESMHPRARLFTFCHADTSYILY